MTESKPIGASTQRDIDSMLRRPALSRAELGEIASTQELRRALVSEHNLVGHPGGVRRAGCAYCYPPGARGDYTPEVQPAPLGDATRRISAAAEAFRDASDEEKP